MSQPSIPPSPGRRFVLAPVVILQCFEEKALLVDLISEQIFQLNDSGMRVCELLSQGQSLGEILETLEQEFEAPAPELERDVRVLLEELLAQRLVVEQVD